MGEVGLGYLIQQPSKESLDDPKDHYIPPVLRMRHEKLHFLEYKRYKQDPLFLFKTIPVCENCYLAFANVSSIPLEAKIPSPTRASTASRSMRNKSNLPRFEWEKELAPGFTTPLPMRGSKSQGNLSMHPDRRVGTAPTTGKDI
jgi:hypothetical protein